MFFETLSLAVHVCGVILWRADQQPGPDLRRLPHAVRLLCPGDGSFCRLDEQVEGDSDLLVRVSAPAGRGHLSAVHCRKQALIASVRLVFRSSVSPV